MFLVLVRKLALELCGENTQMRIGLDLRQARRKSTHDEQFRVATIREGAFLSVQICSEDFIHA